MNVDFASASILPGITHRSFKEDTAHPGAVYESEIDVPGGIISLLWDIFTGDVKGVYIECRSAADTRFNYMTYESVKTYEQLKTLLSLIPLPYPENWP